MMAVRTSDLHQTPFLVEAKNLTPSNVLELISLPCVHQVIPLTTKSLLRAVVIFEMKCIKRQDSFYQKKWRWKRSCVCYWSVKCCSWSDPSLLWPIVYVCACVCVPLSTDSLPVFVMKTLHILSIVFFFVHLFDYLYVPMPPFCLIIQEVLLLSKFGSCSNITGQKYHIRFCGCFSRLLNDAVSA
jgi:hypothetical protein